MAAVDRDDIVPIRPTHDVWQHNPKLHRHLTDSGCLRSDVSRAFDGVQHSSEFLHRSWEKGISNREFEFFSLVCQDALSLAPGGWTQPLPSCVAKMQTYPTTQPCHVQRWLFPTYHIYTSIFTYHLQLEKLQGLAF